MISVVIPAYNYANFISKAIRSVLNQTHTDFELIVIDDGSEDNTDEVVQQFNDKRLRFYRQENRGLSATRNEGIRLSHGEYIAFLDADDEWYPDKLRLQYELIERSPQTGLVYCFCEYFDRHLNEVQVVKQQYRGNIFQPLLRANVIPGTSSTILVRRACFDRLGGFSTELTACEDWHMAARIAAHWDIDFVDQVLARITRHQGSMSKNLDRQEENALKTLTFLEAEFYEHVPKNTWQKSRSYVYLTTGRVQGMNGDLNLARRSFWQALRTDPANLTALYYFTASLLGSNVYRHLRRMRRSTSPGFLSQES